jgi:hypothetical protein
MHIRNQGAVVTLPGRTTYRTILPWMAQETQYCSFRYILGTVYSEKTEASEMSPKGNGQLFCMFHVMRAVPLLLEGES